MLILSVWALLSPSASAQAYRWRITPELVEECANPLNLLRSGLHVHAPLTLLGDGRRVGVEESPTTLATHMAQAAR